MSGNVDTTILDHERWDLRANEAPVPAKTVHRLLDALEEAEKRAEEADRYRDNMSAALLMVGSEACGDPKIDPRDRGDPRWTPTLAAVADMRAEIARLRAIIRTARDHLPHTAGEYTIDALPEVAEETTRRLVIAVDRASRMEREHEAAIVATRIAALREGFEIAGEDVDVITSDDAGYVNPWACFKRARRALAKRISEEPKGFV